MNYYFVEGACLDDADCDSRLTCIDDLCQEVCDQSCGLNAICITEDRVDSCECRAGYTGDPLLYCTGLSFQFKSVNKNN